MATQQTSGGFKIFPQVLLTMFLVALIPLAGFWYLNNVRVQREMRANAEQNLREASDKVAERVGGWADLNLRVLKQNAQLAGLTSMETERQVPILRSLSETYEWVFLAQVVGMDGYMTARSDDEPVFNPDGTKAEFRGDRSYFQNTVETETISQEVIISRTTGKPALNLASPLFGPDQELVGVFSTNSALADISEAVTNIEIGETGFAILVDDKGNAIAHGNLDLDNLDLPEDELLNLSEHPALVGGELKQQAVFEESGKRVVAYTQEVGPGWRLIVQQDYADAFASVIEARRNAFILLAATVLLVVVVASLMARRLVKPIQSLTRAADDMSRGQLEVNISETSRGDEIGALARSVERMGVSIKMAFEELSTSKA